MIRVVTLVLGVLGTNTYVVFDEDTQNTIIVDPGDDPPDILNFVNTQGLRVGATVATHGHLNRVLGVEYLGGNLGVDFYLNKLDTDVADASFRFIPPKHVRSWKPPKPDYLSEGDAELGFGSLVVKSIHTPGSTCLYLQTTSALFSGDTLLRGSVGRSNLLGGSSGELEKGIRRFFSLLPPRTTVYPGYGPLTTLKYEHEYKVYVTTL